MYTYMQQYNNTEKKKIFTSLGENIRDVAKMFSHGIEQCCCSIWLLIGIRLKSCECITKYFLKITPDKLDLPSLSYQYRDH